MDRYAKLIDRLRKETDAVIDKGDDTLTMEELQDMAQSKILYARIKKEFLLANLFGTISLFDLSKLTDDQITSLVHMPNGQDVDDKLDEQVYVTAIGSENY